MSVVITPLMQIGEVILVSLFPLFLSLGGTNDPVSAIVTPPLSPRSIPSPLSRAVALPEAIFETSVAVNRSVPCDWRGRAVRAQGGGWCLLSRSRMVRAVGRCFVNNVVALAVCVNVITY